LTVDSGTLFVDSVNNRVGIGTTTPTQQLVVVGNGNFTGNFSADYNTLYVDEVNDRIGIGTRTPSNQLEILTSTGNDLQITGNQLKFNRSGETYIDQNNGQFNFRMTSDASALYIESDGDIGMGDTSPSYELEVMSDSNASDTIVVENPLGNRIVGLGTILNGDGYLNVRNSTAVTRIALHSNGVSYFNGGNVGIGITAPSQALTVVGDINSTGTLYGNLSWAFLNTYPSACTAGSAITELNDSVTCTAFTTDTQLQMVNSTAVASIRNSTNANLTSLIVQKNITISVNNMVCLNTACSSYMTNNGTGVVIV
jgi:hypothetical protein